MSLTMSLPVHVPVLADEVVDGLVAAPGKRFVDCTVGLGGHAAAILEKTSS
jgi:16S rRNA (cytosine1402-N4)-methyltransferase